jgi:uncharacterized protein YdhG (YjbR/CyaY superfamily)
MPDGIVQFKEELAGCRVRKGTIQFPHNKPLPLDLIARIVQFRVQENRNRAQKKNEQIDRFS